MQPRYPYKMFRIVKNGKPSSISMDPLLATLALQRVGSSNLKHIIQQAVVQWTQQNSNAPCSTYVATALRRHLAAQP